MQRWTRTPESRRPEFPLPSGVGTAGWASALAPLLAAAALAGAPGEPLPQLRDQAAEVKAYALEQIERLRPQWAAEDREFWAESFEKAVLSQAKEPLTEQQLGDVKKAAARAAKVS